MTPTEREVYLAVFIARAVAGTANDAAHDAAAAVLRARKATEQTATLRMDVRASVDEMREMAREVFAAPVPPAWVCSAKGCTETRMHYHLMHHDLGTEIVFV